MKRIHHFRLGGSIDKLTGPLLKKLLLFSLPLMASSVLQLLFNAADVVVVGRKMAALSPSQRNYKTMRLIQNYSWFRGLEISFELDPHIRSLVGHNEYGLIDWESRKKLQENDLAKKLQALFSGTKTCKITRWPS